MVTGLLHRVGRNMIGFRDILTQTFTVDTARTVKYPTDGFYTRYMTYKDRVNNFANFIRKNHDKMFTTTPLTDYDIDHWIDERNYSERRKKQLRNCTRIPRDKYRIDTFVKNEAYPEVKPPRLINAREDDFKVLMGPLTHHIEQDIFKAGYSVKGFNRKEQNKIIYDKLHKYNTFICTDYSRWESSITSDLIEKVEGFLWEKYASDLIPFNTKFIIDHTTNNYLLARKVFVAELKGIRMSGDMHTSLMNTYINIMLSKYIMHSLGYELVGFFEGDDGIMGVDSQLNEKALNAEINGMSKALGFDLKMEVYHNLYEAPFLSTHVISPEISIRNPIKILTHMQFSFSSQPLDELARAWAYLLTFEHKDTPVLHSLGNMLFRILGEGKIASLSKWHDEYYKIPKYLTQSTSPSISTTTRVKFQELFNIPIAMQNHLEKLCDSNDQVEFSRIVDSLILRDKPDWLVNGHKVKPYVFVDSIYDNSIC